MEKTRIAVVGFGQRGGAFVALAMQESAQVELVGICDSSPERLQIGRAHV